MASENTQQLRATAGEYVLGTLDDLERRRFEARLQDEPEARREVEYWEQRLGVLALALEPVQPPDAVWTRIAAVIGSSGAERSRPVAGRTGLWRGIALVASVAALVMATLLFTSRPPTPERPAETRPALAGMVYDKPTGMSWLVTARSGSDQIDVTAMGDYDLPEGKILRAWMIPEGGKPIGLGTMPVTPGHETMTMPPAAAKAADKPMQWVVSLEDQSDADADAPHGKVMWAVPIARRTG